MESNHVKKGPKRTIDIFWYRRDSFQHTGYLYILPHSLKTLMIKMGTRKDTDIADVLLLFYTTIEIISIFWYSKVILIKDRVCVPLI